MAIHELKVDLLRSVDIFAQLREYELDVIAKYSIFTEVRKGDFIFSHGEPSNEFYVVQKGRVGIVGLEDRNRVTIAQVIAGEPFGELDFLGRNERSATAMAEEDCVLLMFPTKKYTADQVFSEHAYISAKMLYRLFGIITERIWRVNEMLADKTGWLMELHKQLHSDKMTGLYNRTYLAGDFVNLLPGLGTEAALIMIKPDNFKEVNDRYGHDAGDQVLRLMAIFLQSEIGVHDAGIRYRGDEFAAVLVDADKKKAVETAKGISRAFKDMDISPITGAGDVKIKVSIGVALYPSDSGGSAGLVDLAHRRMMNARDAGGNRIVI